MPVNARIMGQKRSVMPLRTTGITRANAYSQGSKNLFSNTRQGGSKRKVLVAKVAV